MILLYRNSIEFSNTYYGAGSVAQSVASQIADPGVVSLIPAWPHTFIEMIMKLVSMVIILLLPLI